MTSAENDIAEKIGLKNKRRPAWFWIGGTVLALGLIGAWYVAVDGQQSGAQTYVTEPVLQTDIQVVVSAVGSIEPTDMFDVSSELSGTIEAVLVDYNQPVKVGTVLARLDTTKLEAELAMQRASLDSAKAMVTLAKASLEEARLTYERGKALKSKGVESNATFIGQEAAFLRAQAEVQSALASMHLVEANLELIEADLEKSCICSPTDGIVLDRAVEPGQIIAASLNAPTLFTVAEDLTEMELQVDVDEADIGKVAVGQAASFTVDAYDERSFPAEILQVRFASETVDGVVTYKAILQVENEDLSLRPGMTASADIIVASVQNALAVPNAALRYTPASAEDIVGAGSGGSGFVGMILPGHREDANSADGKQRAVYVLRDDVPLRILVQVGQSDGTVTEVISEQLAPGDAVITDEFDDS